MARHRMAATSHLAVAARRPLPRSLQPPPATRQYLSLPLQPKRSRPHDARPPRRRERRARLQRLLPPHSPNAHQQGSNYRFRVPEGEPITFTDLNLGPQSFITGKDFGDFLIWRRDNLPSYQLACIVDDADTQITEVVRGADLLKSTARQILLQRALNLPQPSYFHTHLLRDEHGLRLAKRHDALAIRTLREHRLTPSQVLALATHSMTSVTSNS
jgi:glutamyl/glutaminyl-tRNA synthetase